MKDFLFFKSEKEKKCYDRFLKKRSQRNQIFIISLTTSYLCIDSLVYLVTWLLDPQTSGHSEVVLLVEFLKILSFTIPLLLYYITKRLVIMKLKSKKILYLDTLMYFMKIVYLVTFMEGEFYILSYLRLNQVADSDLFFLVTMGLKLAMIEVTFLINYFRWPTKIFSLISTCIYLTFRIMNKATFQISSLFAFTIFVIIVVIKIEKEARRFFILQDSQGSFLSSSDKFKYIFENLHEKIIERFFNKSSEGFLFIDKDFKNYHHNEKISQFFQSIPPPPPKVDPVIIPRAPTQQKFHFGNQTMMESKTQTNYNNHASEAIIRNMVGRIHNTSIFNPTSTSPTTNDKGKGSVEQLLGAKLISLKEGPDFMQKFFKDANLKILNKGHSKKANVGFQTNASLDNINSMGNLFQKYSNAVSLQNMCNYFIRKKNKDREKSLSSFSKLQTITRNITNTNNTIAQEEDYHALVEISALFYDEKKLVFKEKSFEVMIFPIFKAGEITHFFFLVQDLGLETQIKQLSLENQNKTKALAFVSHEMRTPLNCTKGMLCMIKEVIAPEHLNNFVLPALTSSEFLLNLLNDLLDVSQIQNGRFKLVYLEFNLRVLLTDILTLFTFMARSKGITFFFTWDEKIPDLIKTDGNRIRQIITNLIGNAMKFTQKGSITLHASLEPKDNTLILIQVIDTGIGIKDENKEKLFTAFGKVDSDENEYLNSQGVGLGLLISNMLAKNLGPSLSTLKKFNMNAGLNMSSKYGNGTTFRFLIEDKNDTDVISRKETKSFVPQLAPVSDVKLLDFLNKRLVDTSRLSEEEKSETNKLPVRVSSFESLKRRRKSKSFVPFGLVKEEDRRSTTSIDKKTINQYKTLVMNDIIGSPFHKKENNFSEFHIETDEEVVKRRLKVCDNNCPRILICDDDYFNLLVLENFLMEFKVKIEKAFNGIEAVEKVKTLYKTCTCCKLYEFIFLDIEMPEKNGFETCQDILKFMDEKNETPPLIIATTGHTEIEEINKIYEYGMNESIPKPIPRKEMIKVMRRLLEEKSPGPNNKSTVGG